MLVVNCPGCSGPMFKADEVDVSRIKITTKCPHCKKMYEVKMSQEIVIVINGKRVDFVPDGSIRMV